MAEATYESSAALAAARRKYYIHSVLNGISFRLVAGNIVTLYALRLGAGNTYIGFLSSFLYFSFVFLLVGRRLVDRMGAVRVQSTFWGLRYLFMIPALITALPAVRANAPLAFGLLAVSVFGFHTSKGIAFAGQKPILGSVAGEKNRGAFLSKVQSLNTTFGTAAWLVLGLVLGREAPLSVYAGTFGLGIVIGVAGASVLSRLSEPVETGTATQVTLLSGLRDGLKNPGYRRLVSITLIRSVLLGMTGAFLIVQFKRVYMHTDSNVVYITLAGNLGIVGMAALAGLLLDKVGAKPLFFAFSLLTAAAIVLVVAGPVVTEGFVAWLIPCLVIFTYQMGATGMFNCGQDYFFAIVSPDERLNYGIYYQIAAGMGGFVGALGGGALLDAMLVAVPLSTVGVFRLYFGMILIVLAALSVYISRLPDIGAYSIRNTLSILFSPRDMRAVRLLQRLDQSQTEDEEQETIRALGGAPSVVSTNDLIGKLESPSFAVRAETLNTLSNHPVDEQLEAALVAEIADHHFTTAHIAAQIAGRQGVRAAVGALREALESDDFMLAGKAMIALAQLGDRESMPRITEIFTATTNPRLTIHGARAFAELGDESYSPVLLSKLAPRIAPFVRDEIILAVAQILRLDATFYQLYSLFVEHPMAAATELRARLTGGSDVVGRLALETTGDADVFAQSARAAMKAMAPRVPVGKLTSAVLSAFETALEDETLRELGRFRFLLAAVLVFAEDAAGPTGGATRAGGGAGAGPSRAP